MSTMVLADVCEFYDLDADPHEVSNALEKMWREGFELFKKLITSVTPVTCEVTGQRTMLYRYTLIFRRRALKH